MDRRAFLKRLCAGAVAAGGALACGLGTASAGGLGAEAPKGRRLAMVVDLPACARMRGCRACMGACHVAHNVPSIAERGHEVKWIWKQRFDETFPEQLHEGVSPDRRASPVPVLCNHCENPPCVRVCPTGATWRRADGIVMMDEHRCIGCRYCMAACPYGARSFNWQDPRLALSRIEPGYATRTVGVVEKCTFCAERLPRGLAPLCVEACARIGANALSFGDLDEAGSPLVRLLGSRQALRRRPGLSTSPHVFYLV